MAEARPNLLFLFTDQQRVDTLACYGNQKLEMPNLNRLAGQSVVFEQPHCTQPVCTPSRGSLMTGLLPFTHGAFNNNEGFKPGVRCLPELLSEEARQVYRTGYMGKWHLGDEIFPQHGFQEWVSTEEYTGYYGEGRDRNRRSSYHYFLRDNGFEPSRPHNGIHGFSREFACRMPERYGKPHFTASRASEFIRTHANQPWLLAVNFLEPHGPFQSCRDDQYDPGEVDLPDNFHDIPNQDQPAFLREMYQKVVDSGRYPDEKAWRRLISAYWGMNSLVDTHVGRILRTLKETGQFDNTVIVFTSDHGEMMGSHQLLNKTIMFKESVRVPMLVRLPGQTRQGRVAGPVSQIDLVPTLLDLMGEPGALDDLQGRSLAELCREAVEADGSVSAANHASPCIVQWTPAHQPCKTDVRTIVTYEGERFSHYYDGSHEFYDLHEDPKETRNLAKDPSRQSRIDELREQIAQWQEATGDPLKPVTQD